MWQALLGDLVLDTPVGVMAARFHKGLAKAIVQMVQRLHRARPERFDTVALSGGVFQNATLLEQVVARLRAASFRVLAHERVPANDGGLALGQALVDAARTDGPPPDAASVGKG
jgi:hydrogenase maturation protein HypF